MRKSFKTYSCKINLLLQVNKKYIKRSDGCKLKIEEAQFFKKIVNMIVYYLISVSKSTL
jgi:hypothetical protein